MSFLFKTIALEVGKNLRCQSCTAPMEKVFACLSPEQAAGFVLQHMPNVSHMLLLDGSDAAGISGMHRLALGRSCGSSLRAFESLERG